MKKPLNIIILAVLLVAVLAGAYFIYADYKEKHSIENVQSSDTGSSQSAGDSQSQDSSGTEKFMAPDFSLKGMDGNTVKLSDYRGKIVILNFWATWCTYCKQELPDLDALNKDLVKNGDNVVILAIDVQESKNLVEKFVSDNKVSLKVLLDEDGALTQTYGVSGFPTTFIINSDGSAYTYIPGATDRATLEKVIEMAKNNEPLQ